MLLPSSSRQSDSFFVVWIEMSESKTFSFKPRRKSHFALMMMVVSLKHWTVLVLSFLLKFFIKPLIYIWSEANIEFLMCCEINIEWNPVNMDIKGPCQSVHIIRISILSRLSEKDGKTSPTHVWWIQRLKQTFFWQQDVVEFLDWIVTSSSEETLCSFIIVSD